MAEVRATLRSVRRRATWFWWTTSVLAPLGAAMLLLVAAIAADHYLVLPAPIRLLLLVAVATVPLWILRRALAAKPPTSDEHVALQVERRFPQLDNLLINSVQLSQNAPPGRRAFVEALTADAAQAVRRIRPANAVPKGILVAATAAAATGAIVLIVMGVLNRQALGTGLNRVLLPYADNTLTRIRDVSPGSCDVRRFSQLQIAARIDGIVPTEARLQCFLADGARMTIPMVATNHALPDRLVATIDQIGQDARYRVAAGDDQSQLFQIRTHSPPAVDRIDQTVHPPAYVQAEPIEKVGGQIHAVVGSTVVLRVYSRAALGQGRLVFSDQRSVPLTFTTPKPEGVAEAHFQVEKRDHYMIELTSARGFVNQPIGYDIVAVEDRAPRVQIVEPTGGPAVDIDATIAIRVRALDDFAVRQVALMRLIPPLPIRSPLPLGEGWGEGKPTWAPSSGDPARRPPPGSPRPSHIEIAHWDLPNAGHAEFVTDVTVRVAELGLTETTPITIQALASDYRPGSSPGASNQVTLRLKSPGVVADAARHERRVSLNELIAKQRTNLEQSKALRTTQPSRARLNRVIDRQEQIRQDALTLSEPREPAADAERYDAPTAVQVRLANLAETLMVLAIEQLRHVTRGPQVPAAVAVAIDTQRAILGALVTADAQQNALINQQPLRDIAQRLAELIGKQRTLRTDTAAEASSANALANRQRVLSRRTAGLHRALEQQAATGAGGDAHRADQYRQMAAAFQVRQVRPNMLVAAERLAAASTERAIEMQDQVLVDLHAIQDLLRQVLLAQAQEEAASQLEAIKQVAQRLDKMEADQQAVTEMARDLRAGEDLTDGHSTPAADLTALTEARQNMADAVEQLVEDLHLFPQMSASNDLLAELGEIFEDVEQAEGSQNDPISEIAVDRDEDLLALLRKMQEQMDRRLADMEMWLADRPDSIKWKQESFDRDELGQIPLGDLPEALEDIVGDLLEQSEALSQQAEDSASNVAIPDAPMGWQVADGPMPSWAAKGKSGNERPNANEQIGRSGSGRQGKSSGEIVGDTVKALAGAEVETRRTDDGFQAGRLKEEDPGAMDVKATGGGKMAGTTETEGMTGNAPPRPELRHLGRRHGQLKRDTESVYTKARLLRLPIGELERALLEMDVASRRLSSQDLAGFARTQTQVVRALRSTHAAISGKPVIERSSKGPGALHRDLGATAEPIPPAYEEAVARYMRRISRPR